MDNFDKNHLALFDSFAKNNGWKQIPSSNPFMVSYEKGEKSDWNRINIWTSNKRWTYTIGTYLKHPKKGKTQLFRRDLTENQVEQFFKDPRKHSGKGYYRK